MTDVPRLSSVVYEEELHAGRNTTLYTYIYTLFQKNFFHIRKKPNKLIIKQETYFVCESKVCLNTFSVKVFRILSIRF